ncbi:hypothetical protein EV127DRAFT_159005 [Xylaria flabelliformis]|nr:hypothetical protein EV127DRAFT_159005 [Xylaria flabelliformis]
MTTVSPPVTCLDVVIDHRIRRLCRPTWPPGNLPEPSTHLSILQRYGYKRGRRSDEINITCQLAGPATTGGILVTLQQPRGDHPFEDGIEAVIHDCDTFSALDELFLAASCGTLNVKDHISLVDLLPFTPQRADSVSSRLLRHTFEASRLAICAKMPDVVLCAGRVWLPCDGGNPETGSEAQEKLDLKEDLCKLEAAGVGRPDPYDAVGLQGNNGELVVMSKVNGFHPACAMTWHPEHTSLRQLLLLNVVKTCGLYRGDWREDRWMDILREECFKLTGRLKDNKQSTSISPTKRRICTVPRRTRHLHDYAPVYSTIQEDFLNSVARIEALQEKDARDIYNTLLASKLSYKCNDASVVLRRVWDLCRRNWPETCDTLNRQCVNDIALDIRRLLEGFVNKPLQVRNPRLQNIFQAWMADLSICVISDDSTINFEKLANVFLQMASSIEEMLGDLLCPTLIIIDD